MYAFTSNFSRSQVTTTTLPQLSTFSVPHWLQSSNDELVRPTNSSDPVPYVLPSPSSFDIPGLTSASGGSFRSANADSVPLQPCPVVALADSPFDNGLGIDTVYRALVQVCDFYRKMDLQFILNDGGPKVELEQHVTESIMPEDEKLVNKMNLSFILNDEAPCLDIFEQEEAVTKVGEQIIVLDIPDFSGEVDPKVEECEDGTKTDVYTDSDSDDESYLSGDEEFDNVDSLLKPEEIAELSYPTCSGGRELMATYGGLSYFCSMADHYGQSSDMDIKNISELAAKHYQQLHPFIANEITYGNLTPPLLPVKGICGRSIDRPTETKMEQIVFNVKSVLLGGSTRPFSVKTVEAVHENPESRKSLPGKVWAVKISRHIDRATEPGETEYYNQRLEYVAELRAYRRIAAAPRADKIGFNFIMELEAAISSRDSKFMVFSLMNGDLFSLVREESIRPNEVRRLIAQTVLGISTLHSIGIVHRDIKPDNILIDERGNAKLTDFGHAFTKAKISPMTFGSCCSKHFRGTSGYLAPEIDSDYEASSYGAPVDYFSLGCVFYELLRNSSGQHKTLFGRVINLEDWVANYSSSSSRDKASKLQLGHRIGTPSLHLLLGLLCPSPLSRFGVTEIITHAYFARNDGTSEFEPCNIEQALHRPSESIDPIADSTGETLIPDPSVHKRSWLNPYGRLYGKDSPGVQRSVTFGRVKLNLL